MPRLVSLSVLVFALLPTGCSTGAPLIPTLTPLPSATPTATSTPVPPAAPTHLVAIGGAAPPALQPSPTLDPNVTAFFAPTVETPPTADPANCVAGWRIPNPPDGCPAQAGVSPALWQPFERGLMAQVAQWEKVYIFYGDGSYRSVYDGWDAGMPEDDPGIEPPPGLLEPVRHLGYAWREHSLSGSLGWAIAPEASYRTTSQCVIPRPETICYLTGPNGEVIQMNGDAGSWMWWSGQ